MYPGFNLWHVIAHLLYSTKTVGFIQDFSVGYFFVLYSQYLENIWQNIFCNSICSTNDVKVFGKVSSANKQHF